MTGMWAERRCLPGREPMGEMRVIEVLGTPVCGHESSSGIGARVGATKAAQGRAGGRSDGWVRYNAQGLESEEEWEEELEEGEEGDGAMSDLKEDE